MSAAASGDPPSFFEQELARITGEIHLTFEELMTHQNALNRKLEEFGPMNKEFGTVAELWKHFHEVISNVQPDTEVHQEGMPGTGYTPRSSVNA